ncbi:hypothetical protein B0H98_1233 [Vreelandella songnenensis]|uniref:Uncharacterized protein n=1 Tax=Vreelandella songnenensis TaxID=1176243 RepID=A0A2T0UI16_9GAMM|nr:hypothetical protein B0H98_1233 [Halomonas songnenensis]
MQKIDYSFWVNKWTERAIMLPLYLLNLIALLGTKGWVQILFFMLCFFFFAFI